MVPVVPVVPVAAPVPGPAVWGVGAVGVGFGACCAEADAVVWTLGAASACAVRAVGLLAPAALGWPAVPAPVVLVLAVPVLAVLVLGAAALAVPVLEAAALAAVFGEGAFLVPTARRGVVFLVCVVGLSVLMETTVRALPGVA